MYFIYNKQEVCHGDIVAYFFIEFKFVLRFTFNFAMIHRKAYCLYVMDELNQSSYTKAPRIKHRVSY